MKKINVEYKVVIPVEMNEDATDAEIYYHARVMYKKGCGSVEDATIGVE